MFHFADLIDMPIQGQVHLIEFLTDIFKFLHIQRLINLRFQMAFSQLNNTGFQRIKIAHEALEPQ